MIIHPVHAVPCTHHHHITLHYITSHYVQSVGYHMPSIFETNWNNEPDRIEVISKVKFIQHDYRRWWECRGSTRYFWCIFLCSCHESCTEIVVCHESTTTYNVKGWHDAVLKIGWYILEFETKNNEIPQFWDKWDHIIIVQEHNP